MGVQRARSDESQCRRENTNKSPACVYVLVLYNSPRVALERVDGWGSKRGRQDGREIIDFLVPAQPLRRWLGHVNL